MNYKKINNVMNFIPKALREMQADDDQWLSWALQALRTVNTHELVAQEFAILEVVDHKALLPKGLKRITSIKMGGVNISDAEYASIAQCMSTEPRDTTTGTSLENVMDEERHEAESNVQYFNESCGINVQLFMASGYYNQSMKPLQYKGIATTNPYLSKACLNACMTSSDCYTGFSISPEGCIFTDVPEGIICINYESEVKDDDGNFLIPNEPTALWNGMAHYAMAQYWLNKMSNKEQSALQFYRTHQQISSSFMREAKGIFRMKNINIKLLTAITYRDTDSLRIPSVWTNRIDS